ncbi:hypothetical protein J2X19_000320 [Rhodoferax ferrireducens]|uniref:Uncharacterized protein n=1 Tax=Rhodoferax ferrireducens TaxID=192843 RepID=A0ABU2C354_9BURK|nr:hypothetical protein [Rhodoferax ferrireducens]
MPGPTTGCNSNAGMLRAAGLADVSLVDWNAVLTATPT